MMSSYLNNFFKRISPILLVIGRGLLGLYFVLPGILKFIAWDTHVALMEKHGMIFIPFFLAVAAIVEIVAGLAIIFNRYTAFFALVLAGVVVAINVTLHDFWNVASEQQNFIKNMAIFAGLLILSATS